MRNLRNDVRRIVQEELIRESSTSNVVMRLKGIMRTWPTYYIDYETNIDYGDDERIEHFFSEVLDTVGYISKKFGFRESRKSTNPSLFPEWGIYFESPVAKICFADNDAHDGYLSMIAISIIPTDWELHGLDDYNVVATKIFNELQKDYILHKPRGARGVSPVTGKILIIE